jgi:hypothetical protein
MVDGEVVVDNGQPTAVDLVQLRRRVAAICHRVWSEVLGQDGTSVAADD